jgi:hypothetical protein
MNQISFFLISRKYSGLLRWIRSSSKQEARGIILTSREPYLPALAYTILKKFPARLLLARARGSPCVDCRGASSSIRSSTTRPPTFRRKISVEASVRKSESCTKNFSTSENCVSRFVLVSGSAQGPQLARYPLSAFFQHEDLVRRASKLGRPFFGCFHLFLLTHSTVHGYRWAFVPPGPVLARARCGPLIYGPGQPGP